MSTTIRTDPSSELPTDDTRVLNAPAAPAPAYSFLRPPEAQGEMGRLGNYRVIRLLGSGGMGKVFLAEDLTLHRPVALKVMCLPEGDDLESGWERFLREARSLAAINHPNLVTVYQAGHEHSTIFLAMELLAGETLHERIRRESRLAVEDIVRIAEQIATGLHAIHERGLIHRDIKPSNIWLVSAASEDTEPLEEESDKAPSVVSQVKILDFGLVRNVNSDTQLTDAGIVMGTPAYMSPEQVRGHTLDRRTDLFSFGCVLYAMATGRVPFEASNALAQAAALAADEPTRARKLNPAIPRSLSNLIAELLAKNPDDRPDSAAEVLERLRKLRDEPAAESRKDTPAAPTRPQRSFLRYAIAIVALVWLIAAGLVAFALTRDGKQREEQSSAPQGDAPQPRLFPPGVLHPGTPADEYLCNLPKVAEKTFPPPGAPQPPNLDKTVRIGNVPSPHGIFMHGAPEFETPPFVSYSLDKKYSRFAVDVAMNDSAGKWCGLVFVVSADGKEVWKSPKMTAEQPAEHCDIDVRDAKILTLEVRTSGSDRGAHGAWIEPRLTK
jgi:serine/threonine protein kinase